MVTKRSTRAVGAGTTIGALAGIWTLTAALAAQSPSVLDGVYSSAQAERGKRVYLLDCAQCHAQNLMGGEGATELVGPSFLARWNGQTIEDLYVAIERTMPVDSPGALSGREYTDVLAYILSKNEFPTGGQDLPQSPDAMKAIRILPKSAM